MMRKKKTARPTSKKASGKAPYKRQRPRHLPLTNVLLIDAGYRYPDQSIDELLELAGADTNHQSRRDLVNVLQLAQMAWEDEKNTSSRRRPSPKQIQQLEASIEKTRMLLTQIREYDDFRNIGFVTQQIGRGVVAPPAQGLPRNPAISDQELIFPKIDGQVVGMNIEPLLRATLLATRRIRRGRGGPKNLAKESVVFYAADYFRKHSPKEPSTDPANPFHPFVERFYEVVTKTKPSGFDRQMRKIFRANRSGH